MKNEYCNIQENCKMLIQAGNQYDAVVKQNQSLQAELRFANECRKSDEEYIRQLEERNMILEEKVQELKYFISHPVFFISKVGADEDLFKFIVRSATKQNLVHIEMDYALPPEKAQMNLTTRELEDLLYTEVENAVRRDRSKRITFERVRNGEGK